MERVLGDDGFDGGTIDAVGEDGTTGPWEFAAGEQKSSVSEMPSRYGK